MSVEKLRSKSDAELREELTGLMREQFNLRMQKGTGQLDQPNEIRRVRREIARVKTIMNEKASKGSQA
jgi:large subunit ribosomal protein L29